MSRRGRQRGAESQRQLRVGEAVRHALVDLLQRGSVHDPGLADVILTVAEVRMSPDLRQAAVFVSELGADRLSPEVNAALKRASPFLRGEVARRVNLKYAPVLVFRADETHAEVARIDALIAAERARLADRAGDDDGAP
jgi:ribosome-binding factor A